MLYLSGVRRPDIPFMANPRNGMHPPEGQAWAADNGRYGSPHTYSDEKYLAWLGRLAYRKDDCLFATAPDVVGDAGATLAMSAPMFSRIRDLGYPVALVAQDGLESLSVPWDDFDALFIGGTTQWKMGSGARSLALAAVSHGKWVHMGRVNSLRRFLYAQSIGCQSADGTVLKHDPSRNVSRWQQHAIENQLLWKESR